MICDHREAKFLPSKLTFSYVNWTSVSFQGEPSGEVLHARQASQPNDKKAWGTGWCSR